MTQGTISSEERHRILANYIGSEVSRGARIESQTPEQAVIVYGKPVNHLLHFLIGFPTVGVWWITVWPALAVFGGEKRKVVRIDEYGNIIAN